MAKFTDEQVNAIVLGPRGFRTYAFPGTEGTDREVKIAVRVLTEAEIDNCKVQAQQYIRDTAKKRGWDDPVVSTDIDPEQFDRYRDRLVLYHAVYDPDTTAGDKPERFFPTPDDVARLDAVTVQRLFNLYAEHQQYVAPFRTATEEEVKAIVDALGKGQSAPALLDTFDRSTLVRLLISLASVRRTTT